MLSTISQVNRLAFILIPHSRKEEPDPWNYTYRELNWKSRSGDGEGLPRQLGGCRQDHSLRF